VSDIIQVRVAKLGEPTKTVPLARNSTVGDVLRAANLYPVPGGHQVRLDNDPAAIDDPVRPDSIVTLVPKVRAG
jgi:hypothetical protein